VDQVSNLGISVPGYVAADEVFSTNRLRALVAKRDWNEIEDISRQRKAPPIGWEVSAILCANFVVATSGANLPILLAIFQPDPPSGKPTSRGIVYSQVHQHQTR